MNLAALKIIFILLGLAYFVSPWDLIPDFFGLLGRLDDLLVLGFLYYQYHHRFKAFSRKLDAEFKQPTSMSSGQKSTSPWEVLELPRNATIEQITQQYKKLMAQYHPDKVNHLGIELQKLAHEKTIQIKKAYDVLCASSNSASKATASKAAAKH